MTVYTDAQVMLLQKYTKLIVERIRARPKYIERFNNKPIWISEIYIGNTNATNAAYQKAQWASLLRNCLLGAREAEMVPLFWQPEESLGDLRGWFTDTNVANGGYEITPGPYAVWKMLKINFPPGTQMKVVTSTSVDVEGLASATKLMLINRASIAKTVQISGGSLINMAAYDVQMITLSGGSTTT